MQSALADLFIDIVNNKSDNKRLIIETHSEYLLKRLRRRIAEKKIEYTDVAIYLFNPKSNEQSAYIEKLEISSTGDFKWPKDFYDDEITDTIEFLKKQI